MFLQGVSSEPPHEYLSYVLCKELGWTYQDLMVQPRFFVEQMLQVIKVVKSMGKN